MTKPVVLTGIRANNELTIGNYFGAMLPMIDMARQKSDEYQVNMFIPDLHSFTTPIDHAELYDQIINNARLFVAAGLPLDNDSIFLYRQSYIPAHSELTWILDCFTGFGEMSRMTQFKDKTGLSDKLLDELAIDFIHNKLGKELYDDVLLTIEKERKTLEGALKGSETKTKLARAFNDYLGAVEHERQSKANVGLFNYPVLMAADILLYGASYVPVGEDQTQHLEFTRDIAERMNARFGELFTVPEPVAKQHEFFGNDQGLRIKDLLEPTKKMSKSDETGRGVIFLSDDPKEAARKIMSAATDSVGEVHFNRALQPGISNLLEILALLRGQKIDEVVQEFEGQTRYGDFKQVVAAEVERFLTDFQAKLSDVSDEAITAKLETSETAMNAVANQTLLRAQQAVGLRPKAN